MQYQQFCRRHGGGTPHAPLMPITLPSPSPLHPPLPPLPTTNITALAYAQGEGDSAFVGSNRLFPFSTVVFASWDYHLTDAAAARNLRHSIRNQLKEMVNDAVLADKIEDTRTKVKAYIRKVPTHLSCSSVCKLCLSSYNQESLAFLETSFTGYSAAC